MNRSRSSKTSGSSPSARERRPSAERGWSPLLERDGRHAICNQYGLLILAGEHSDSFLQRKGFGPGYAIVVHRGDRHMTEPTELSEAAMSGYWAEVMAVSRAIERTYEPVKMNLMMLGNQLPHLHTHVVPRYGSDADAGGPPVFDDQAPARDEEQLRREAEELRVARP